MKAAECPVCDGKGQVCEEIDGNAISVNPITKPCHGCEEWGSRGWVVIPDGGTKVEVKYSPRDTSY